MFLGTSENGTLFDDLDFLAYHPEGRFDVRHLLFYEGDSLIGLLAAAIVTNSDGTRSLQAPYGASTGGVVLPRRVSPQQAVDLCIRLTLLAPELGVDHIDLRIAPSIYSRNPSELLSFALASSGFKLIKRWLTMSIPLPSPGSDVFKAIPGSKRRKYIRSTLKNGVAVAESTADSLRDFYEVLLENRAMKGAVPTHSLEELQRLFELKPDRFKLYVATFEDLIIGGTVMFDVTDRVTYSFYPCHAAAYNHLGPTGAVFVKVMEDYCARGFRYVDMGPTGWYDFESGMYRLPAGLTFFKQEMGGIGFCRDAWRWTRHPAAAPTS